MNERSAEKLASFAFAIGGPVVFVGGLKIFKDGYYKFRRSDIVIDDPWLVALIHCALGLLFTIGGIWNLRRIYQSDWD